MKLSQIFKVHYTKILESEVKYKFSDSADGLQFNNSSSQVPMDNLTSDEYNALIAFKVLPEDSKREIIELINKKIKDVGHKNSKKNIKKLFD